MIELHGRLKRVYKKVASNGYDFDDFGELLRSEDFFAIMLSLAIIALFGKAHDEKTDDSEKKYRSFSVENSFSRPYLYVQDVKFYCLRPRLLPRQA